MALIDHILRCNRWTPADFLDFSVAGVPVGRLRPQMAKRLRDFPALFTEGLGGIALSDRFTTPAERSEAMRPVAEKLAADGLIHKLRHEDYRVVADWGQAALLAMDRSLVPALGIRAFGIHVNGVVRRADGPRLWIGTRAYDKSVEPGKLDNMVAGGQPAELALQENLVKEAGEEAGLSTELALTARSCGAITYCMEEGEGLRRDTLFLYDLEMPEEVKPRAVDGEMQSFSLRSLPELLDLLRDGFSFKFNVALVIIDFMIRNGFVTADNEPDYLALITGLHRSFDQ